MEGKGVGERGREAIWLWECASPLRPPGCPFVTAGGFWDRQNQGKWPDGLQGAAHH